MSTGNTSAKPITFGTGFGLFMTARGAVKDIKAGKPIVSTVVKAAASELIYATPLSTPLMVANYASMGIQYGVQKGRQNAQTTSRAYEANFGGNYDISTNGATLRQRGLQAIEHANANTRSVLGSEARSFHRSNFVRGY